MSKGKIPGHGRQHTPPLFISRLDEPGTARVLDPIGFGQDSIHHDESWLQRLIFEYPQVIPANEIEPGFGRLIPVCLELPTPAGFVDNLYITPSGDLIIAECKLWRNPQSRREVVAQIIDYAQAMANWTFEELEDAAEKGTIPGGEKPSSLYSLIEEPGELSEADFVDAITRNLRLGRILLLVIGDGIREGVESLAGFLQLHAGFHFTLGIIEMPVFSLPNEGYVVNPRVLVRTVNIERGIVRVIEGNAFIEASSLRTGPDRVGTRTSISQDRLLEILASVDPELPDAVYSFVDKASEFGVVLEAAPKSLQIRWRGPDDTVFALAGINENGELLTYNINWRPDSLGHIDLSNHYLEQIAELVGGEVRKTSHPGQWYVVLKGTKQQPLMMTLLQHQAEWIAIIEDYTQKLMAVLSE